jgi:hypothetical protein
MRTFISDYIIIGFRFVFMGSRAATSFYLLNEIQLNYTTTIFLELVKLSSTTRIFLQQPFIWSE